MPSFMMRVAAVWVRLRNKKNWTSAERALARMNGPKGPHAPPASLRERHLVEERVIGGFTCYRVSPRSGGSDRALMYLHGGAYMSEIAEEHWTFIDRVVSDARCTVEVPIYGLAPKFTFRDAYALMDFVYSELVTRFPPERICIGGDSAGGGLALGFAQSLVASGRAVPGRVLLIAPWLDIALEDPELARVDRVDPWLSPPGLIAVGKVWTGDADPHDPRLSPIHGKLAGLPPIELFVGTRDLCIVDSRKLVARAREAGVEIAYREVEGAIHAYPLAPLPEGRAAVRGIIETLRAM